MAEEERGEWRRWPNAAAFASSVHLCDQGSLVQFASSLNVERCEWEGRSEQSKGGKKHTLEGKRESLDSGGERENRGRGLSVNKHNNLLYVPVDPC